MKIVFTFPGQGAQFSKMLHRLPDTETTHRLLTQASQVLNESCLELDTPEALRSTRAVQLCILISGVVYANYLLEQQIQPDFTSGLSIGAFPAAVVAGALDYQDAVRLVSLRGQLMEQAYPDGYGLSAIVGLSRWQVEELIQQVNAVSSPVYLANLNAEDQIVIAGSEAAMAAVMRLANQQGARKTQRLLVSVPSHCVLLNQPAEQLFQAMQKVNITRPTIAYLSGSSGRVLWQPERILEDLAFNMARTVQWHEAMLSAYEREVRLAIEMPPGSVLTSLTKPVMLQGEAIALSQSHLDLVKVLAKRVKVSVGSGH